LEWKITMKVEMNPDKMELIITTQTKKERLFIEKLCNDFEKVNNKIAGLFWDNGKDITIKISVSSVTEAFNDSSN
jgi:hypothetical protein